MILNDGAFCLLLSLTYTIKNLRNPKHLSAKKTCIWMSLRFSVLPICVLFVYVYICVCLRVFMCLYVWLILIIYNIYRVLNIQIIKIPPATTVRRSATCGQSRREPAVLYVYVYTFESSSLSGYFEYWKGLSFYFFFFFRKVRTKQKGDGVSCLDHEDGDTWRRRHREMIVPCP